MGKAAIPNDSFYYIAGLVVGNVLGNQSIDFKHKFINEFKQFVDVSGGQVSFRDPEEAVKKFMATFKGDYRVPSKIKQ